MGGTPAEAGPFGFASLVRLEGGGPVLAIFPELLPEEPLYSVVARYGEMMDLPGDSVLARHVFGIATIFPAVDLPVRIDGLMSRLPRGFDMTATRLLDEHTALPYYGAFLPPERARAVVTHMREGASGSLASKAGIAASNVKPPRFLHYCRTCASLDLEGDFGAPYWRRVHQLPGVVVCPWHAEELIATRVERSGRRGATRTVTLRRAIGKSGRVVEVRKRVRPLALTVAQNSQWLLEHRPQGASHAELKSRMLCWFQTVGWSGGQRVQWEKVRDTAEQHGGRALFRDLGLERGVDGDWFKGLARGRGAGPTHPLQRIVLLALAGVSMESFFEVASEGPAGVHVPDPKPRTLLVRASQPGAARLGFGAAVSRDGPLHTAGAQRASGPCANPQCHLYDPPTPRAFPFAGARDQSGRVLVLCDACGFSYRVNPSNPKGRGRWRIVSTGAAWDAKLKVLVPDDSVSIAALQAELGVAGKATIQRHALRLGVWRDSWGDATLRLFTHLSTRMDQQREQEGERRLERRRRWVQFREKHPNATRSELADWEKSLYSLLKRYDAA